MSEQPNTNAGLALYLSGVLQDDVAGARILPAILAIEAEARATPPALDVERLARALATTLNCGGCDKDQRHAEGIAAEYARLTSEEPSDG